MHPKVKISKEKTILQSYLTVQEVSVAFQRFDGNWQGPVTRQVVRRGQAVVVLPYDPVLDQVLLIEQFRLPALYQGFDPWLLELPAGMCDHPGESVIDLARREMFEETGLEIADLALLHSFLPTPGVLAETLHLYVGRCDLTPLQRGHATIHGKHEEGEDIRLRPLPFAEIATYLAEQKIINAPAMLGLYWLLLHRMDLQQKWNPA